MIRQSRPEHNGDEFSRKHPKLSRNKRAKLFLPFDALRGFSAELDIAKDDTMLFEKSELDADELARVEASIRTLSDQVLNGQDGEDITVVYFSAKKKNSEGVDIGLYEVEKGKAQKVDGKNRRLVINDRTIDFDDISDITV